MADVPSISPCLVIIDVQQGMFAFRRPLCHGEEVLERIADHKVTDLAALLPWNWPHAIYLDDAA